MRVSDFFEVLQNKSLQPAGSSMKKKNIHKVDLEQRIGNRQDSIFFIESNDKLTEFRPRLLCAFESAAMQNPDKMVRCVPLIWLSDIWCLRLICNYLVVHNMLLYY